MRLKKCKILSIGILLTLSIPMITGIMIEAVIASGNENGPKSMDLFGGTRGKVPFPHQKHQIKLDDCNACHALFPKTGNAISVSMKSGRLKSKQVMNKLCIKCHKTEQKNGNPSGPTTCSKCHVK